MRTIWLALGGGTLTTAVAIVIAKAQTIPDIWYGGIIRNSWIVPFLVLCSAMFFAIAGGYWGPLRRLYWKVFAWLIPADSEDQAAKEGGAWLGAIAVDDRSQFPKGIYVEVKPPDNDGRLIDGSLYIPFRIVNATVFDTAIDEHINGFMLFEGRRLPTPQFTEKPRPLKRRESSIYTIRQRISPDDLAKFTERLEGNGPVAFSYNTLEIKVRADDPSNKDKSVIEAKLLFDESGFLFRRGIAVGRIIEAVGYV